MPLPAPTALLTAGAGSVAGVPEVARAFEPVSRRALPHRIVARRPGDVAAGWADAKRARALLGRQARRGADAMCVDAWHRPSMDPDNSAADPAETAA